MRDQDGQTSISQPNATDPCARDVRQPLDAPGLAVASIALLDGDGAIVAVNEVWRQFARDNGGHPDRCGIGMSYLGVCDAAGDDEASMSAAVAIRAALAGELASVARIRTPCGYAGRLRWFDLLVSQRRDAAGRPLGATVSLTEIEAPDRRRHGQRAGGAGPLPTAVDVAALRRRWQAASADIGQELFAGDRTPPVQVVLRRAVAAADADFALLCLPHGDEELHVGAAVGEPAERFVGQNLPLAGAVCAATLREGRWVLVEDAGADQGRPGGGPRSGRGEVDIAGTGPVMAVPLLAADGVMGALTVGRRRSRAPFSQWDVEQLAAFAGHAAVALELERARADHDHLTILRERDRIATELHGRVMRDLMAVTVGLQGLAGALTQHDQVRLLGYVDRLDDTMRQVRATIYRLHTPASRRGGLRQRVLDAVDDEIGALGLDVRVDFAGAIDTAVPHGLGDELVALVSELLAAMAQHGRHDRIDISVARAAGVLTAVIADPDGAIAAADGDDGLAGARRRAEERGGTLTVGPGVGGRAELRWSVPC
jgi:signal transduction histidine kinase